MKVRFANEVLENPETWRWLDKMTWYFWEGRHHWEIENPEHIENSAWIKSDVGRAGRQNRDALEKCVTAEIYPDSDTMEHNIEITVVGETTSDNELSPVDADSCLQSPAFVFVENVHSDGAFLEALLKAFHCRTLLDAKKAGWWCLENLGGFGDVGKRIEQKKNLVGPLRVFVLVDSDRQYPGEITHVLKKVSAECESHEVDCHVLHKRKIENYVPFAAFSHKVPNEKRKKILAYLTLTEEQQAYYELKKSG